MPKNKEKNVFLIIILFINKNVNVCTVLPVQIDAWIYALFHICIAINHFSVLIWF